MRNAILILCLVLWLILGWFYCQSSIECCQNGSAAATELPEQQAPDAESGSGQNLDREAIADDYIMFRWSDNDPILRDDWDKYKDELISDLSDEEFMEITGLYREGEINNTSFDNLGLARANQIRSLMVPPLSNERIVIKSRLAGGAVDTTQPFSSIDFRSYAESEGIDESLPDKTIIRFPFNSTSKISNPAIIDYLDKVALRVKTSNERIRLTGHTDDVGGSGSNMTLGQLRADFIKNYLVGKGVASDKIITNSRGESAPVANNDNAEGRAQNRRVELEIIK